MQILYSFLLSFSIVQPEHFPCDLTLIAPRRKPRTRSRTNRRRKMRRKKLTRRMTMRAQKSQALDSSRKAPGARTRRRKCKCSRGLPRRHLKFRHLPPSRTQLRALRRLRLQLLLPLCQARLAAEAPSNPKGDGSG